MFADSLYDSASSHRFRGARAVFFSFGLQSLGIAVLFLLPLIYTQALPHLSLLGQLVAPTAPPGPPPPTGPARARSSQPESNMLGTELVMPARIPQTVANFTESDVPPAPDLGSWIPGATGPSGTRNVVADLFGNGVRAMPVAPPPTPSVHPTRVSHMMEGNLIHRVQPEYPALARQAHIQGAVVLRAVISREGKIENLQSLSGHPMLVPAAIDAVRQWRYHPYLLNDQPVEVETTVTVNFVLSGGI
jgi:protein TonB